MKLIAVTTGGTVASTKGTDGLAASLSGRRLTENFGFDGLIEAFCLPSPELGPEQWLTLARIIASQEADGFVVTHGTDTMAQGAATLAFLLAGFDHPIVMTGAMRAPGEPDADGPSNLRDARDFVQVLAGRRQNGVFLAFGGQLLWGAGLVKRSRISRQGFVTPTCPPLGERQGERIELDHDLLAARTPRGGASLPDRLPTVLGAKLHGGLPTAALTALLPLGEGFVLESYGCGSGPLEGTTSILPFLDEARRLGKPVVGITECVDGVDLTRYRNGQRAAEAGLLSGRTMTYQAALAKTAWLLSQCDKLRDFANRWAESLCGE